MLLLRAINPKEMKEFLNLNNLRNPKEISDKKEYLFRIHKDTIWVDNRVGVKRWNVFDIAKSNPRAYSGIVLEIKIWRVSRKFKENPGDPGKYYCTETHVRNVNVR